MNKDKDAWVIIPAYNEANRINNVILGVKEYIDNKNIVVVDDGSKDKLSEIIDDKKIIVLRHIINLGKGASLKTGCDFAIRKGAEKIIFIDADGQHDTKEIPNFLNSLDQGNDIVFSYRIMRENMPLVMKFGNWVINKTTGILFGINMKDTQSGYKALTADAYRQIRWRAGGYYVESEIVANTGKKHLKYKEIPIQTIYSDKYKGTTFMDGIKIVFNMFLWRLKG